MSRYVNPNLFTLRASQLVEAARQKKTTAVLRYFPKSNGNIPVALRWATISSLGFPREPFQVFRRQRLAADTRNATKVVTTPITLTNNATQLVSVVAAGDAAYLVEASVTVPASNIVVIQAVDSANRNITGQSVSLTTSGIAEFRCPGIYWLRVSGTGTVNAVIAIGENAYANLPDWQRIDTVGLPLKNGEVGASYKTNPQGFEPPTQDGVTAAQIRTGITALLQIDPPATGIADFPLPAWPAPDPAAYVNNLRGTKNLVPMIERCLTKTDDHNLLKLQADYKESVSLDGIQQADLPNAPTNPGQTTDAQLPITGLAMMMVSTECYAAVGLGYGTVDVPPQPTADATAPIAAAAVALPPQPTLPSSDTHIGFDYMVTAPFVFPPPFGGAITLAALSSGELPVQAPVSLQAKVKQINAPLSRNAAAPAVINVSWAASTVPQGYGLIVSRAPNSSEVLNTARPAAVKGFDAYIGLAPVNPDPNTPPDQQNPTYSDTKCALPLALPATNERYLVAGLDVFGLWSSWSSASASLAPAPVTKPAVRSAQFIVDTAHATGHVVPATLQIDFGWDWHDRAPSSIRFTGQFLTAPATGLGPTAYLSGLQLKPGAAASAPATVNFAYTNAADAAGVSPSAKIPVIDAAHTEVGPVVVLKTTDFNPSEPQVTYRVEISGFTLDFTTATEIDFALYVTGSEYIRPTLWSDPTDPAMKFIGALVRTFDPFPPVINFAPPSISWTALPDATGKARGILQWTADPKAAGYFVWEATESAINHILQPGVPDPPPSTPLVTRGGTLKSLITANQAASLQGFARLNKDPIPGNRTEIVLPAAASTLYAYRISAVSAGNVEASRSDQVAIFGVPRRNVPGAPRLLLRSVTTPQAGIQVIGLHVETGGVPSGYRVFRVRSAALSYEGSTMGPAKLDENHAGWSAYSGVSKAGKPLTGKSIVDTAATPSWYPYYYRIKAIGAADLNNGLYSGESDFSALQPGYVLPSGPPLNTSFAISTNGTGALITLVTDLPAAAVSPVGPALVEVIQLTTPSGQVKPVAQSIIKSAPDQILVGTLVLPPRTKFPPIVHPVNEVATNLKLEAAQVTPSVQPSLVQNPPKLTTAAIDTTIHPMTPVVTANPIKPVSPTQPVSPVVPVIPIPIPTPGPTYPPPPPTPTLRRSDPDINGRWTLYILIPYTSAQQNTFMVRLTDPLGRPTVKSF